MVGVVITNPVSRQAIACMNFHTPVNGLITAGDKKITVGVVSTVASREQGLSGRPCIKDNQAMMFVFDKDDKSDHCFWMKDMRFAIDIIWLDSSKRVVDIARNVQPESYPSTFCPGRPTAYVVEVKAGSASKLGLDVGVVASF